MMQAIVIEAAVVQQAEAPMSGPITAAHTHLVGGAPVQGQPAVCSQSAAVLPASSARTAWSETLFRWAYAVQRNITF